jgi:putative acetyltransferase
MGAAEGFHRIWKVSARDVEVHALVDALTDELALGGYTAEQTFGLTPAELEQSGVHLVGVRVAGALVAVGGIDVQPAGLAELKRFYVRPAHRGTGVGDALMAAVLEHASAQGVRLVRLETGDKQHAAIRFYRRHGFSETPRFPPYTESETSICMQRPLV